MAPSTLPTAVSKIIHTKTRNLQLQFTDNLLYRLQDVDKNHQKVQKLKKDVQILARSVFISVLVVFVFTAILNQSLTVGNNTFLYCKNDGKVIWSKGADKGRSDMLTAEHGDVTVKLRPDPDHRYSVLSDLSLLIKNLSLSDSGIYFCNAVPVVNLTVTTLHSKYRETLK